MIRIGTWITRLQKTAGKLDHMRHSLTTLALALTATLCTSVLPAAADETGMASIHSWRRVDGKTCMVDHQHHGDGSGPSEDAAMRDAISSWQGFTDFEYGSDWASWNNAIEKRRSCSRTMSGVSCNIDATPCRPGVGGKATQRRTRR